MALTTGLADIVRARFDQMRGRLVTTLGRLEPEDLHWRPNEESNSIGNLATHICGALDQWLLQRLGGAPGSRDRDAEFEDRTPRGREALIAQVEATFAAVDRLLSELPAERLDAPVPVRTETVTGTALLVRMIAHTGEHLGQILYIAKARMGDRFDSLSIPLRRRG